MEAYLDDPQGVVPGTSMPDPRIENPETLRILVDILEALKKKS